MKVPLILRSILSGFAVSTIGVWTWVLLVTYIPPIWAVVSMIPLLVLYWFYFSGNWSPSSTKEYRQSQFRRTQLSSSVWIWGVAAAILIVIFLNAAGVLTLRLIEFPDSPLTAAFLHDFPAWISWPLIFMASCVAGICEEVGFRGYMQKPLEEKYGPIIGISITSFIFVIVHLHQAWASGMLIHIFVISFMLGYLAYSSKSLIPGIIAHISFDVINFSYWWSEYIGTLNYETIYTSGMDTQFIISAAALLLTTILFITAIKKLLNLRPEPLSV